MTVCLRDNSNSDRWSIGCMCKTSIDNSKCWRRVYWSLTLLDGLTWVRESRLVSTKLHAVFLFVRPGVHFHCKAWLTQSRFYRRPSATTQSRGGRGMVGSSVVYCRRCGRAWSPVVAWCVVALFGRLWVLKCSKLSGDHRRPKFLSSVVVGQLQRGCS